MGEHKAENMNKISHKLILFVILKVLHSIFIPQEVQNKIFKQAKLWWYLYLRGLNGIGYMIVRRNKIIKFRYLVNNNSGSGYHKRL